MSAFVLTIKSNKRVQCFALQTSNYHRLAFFRFEHFNQWTRTEQDSSILSPTKGRPETRNVSNANSVGARIVNIDNGVDDQNATSLVMIMVSVLDFKIVSNDNGVGDRNEKSLAMIMVLEIC